MSNSIGHHTNKHIFNGRYGSLDVDLCFTLPSCTQAFNMIDQNRDGFIDHEDLKDMLASLGELTGTLVG